MAFGVRKSDFPIATTTPTTLLKPQRSANRKRNEADEGGWAGQIPAASRKEVGLRETEPRNAREASLLLAVGSETEGESRVGGRLEKVPRRRGEACLSDLQPGRYHHVLSGGRRCALGLGRAAAMVWPLAKGREGYEECRSSVRGRRKRVEASGTGQGRRACEDPDPEEASGSRGCRKPLRSGKGARRGCGDSKGSLRLPRRGGVG